MDGVDSDEILWLLYFVERMEEFSGIHQELTFAFLPSR